MIKTRVISGEECRKLLQQGVDLIANPVGSTLGPRGCNVGMVKSTPRGDIYARDINHDGVSVARSIDVENEGLNFSAQILKEAAQRQVDKVGDGTTVSMILAQAIVTECFKLINSGVNPMSLSRGLEDGVELLVKELEAMAQPINGKKDLEFVATISSRDKELGRLIAEAFDKLGVDGVITPEESKLDKTVIEYQEGMQLDRGYAHPWLVTNPERMEMVLENAYFLITDKPVTSLNELSGLLNEFVKMSKMLVLISPDISGEALPLLIQNKLDNKLYTMCIQAPSFGEDQRNILQDIAVLTNAKFISNEAGHKFSEITIDDLGFAEYICATKDETIISGGRGKKEAIASRIASIKKTLEDTSGDFDKERIKARLGKLTNGIAVIRIGGVTEVEMKETRERVLDSIAATRAAMEKGIVAGGETIYLHIRKALKEPTSLEDKAIYQNPITDKILYQALYKPFHILIKNADLDEIEMAFSLQKKNKNYGIDVIDGQAKDMIKAGIIDPVLVPIEAIKNAVSVATKIITTQNLVVPVEVKKHE